MENVFIPEIEFSDAEHLGMTHRQLHRHILRGGTIEKLYQEMADITDQEAKDFYNKFYPL